MNLKLMETELKKAKLKIDGEMVDIKWTGMEWQAIVSGHKVLGISVKMLNKENINGEDNQGS